MDNFFIFLPSNSSLDYYPESTLTSYKVKLPDLIQLRGRYEIGLKELHYPRNWTLTKISIHPPDDGAVLIQQHTNAINPISYPLVLGNQTSYETLDVLAHNINRKIRKIRTSARETEPIFAKDRGDILPKLVFDKHLGRYVIYNDNDEDKGFKLQLSTSLAHTFGFSSHQMHTHHHMIVAENSIPNHCLDYLYIYCDLVEPSIVGNVRAPLLRIIDVRGKANEVVSTVFEQPLYFPIMRSTFETVEILLRDDAGQPIPFESNGRVVAVLQVRKIAESI